MDDIYVKYTQKSNQKSSSLKWKETKPIYMGGTNDTHKNKTK